LLFAVLAAEMVAGREEEEEEEAGFAVMAARSPFS